MVTPVFGSSSLPTIVYTVSSTVYSTVKPILPLETAFTPPASCLASTFSVSPLGYDTYYFVADEGVTRGSDPSCYPPGYIATSAVTPLPATSIGDGSILTPGETYISTTSTVTTTSTLTQYTISPVGCPASYMTAATIFTLYNSQPYNIITCCPPSLTLESQTSEILNCVGTLDHATLSFVSSEYDGSMYSSSTTSTVGRYQVSAKAIVALSPTVTSTTVTTASTGIPNRTSSLNIEPPPSAPPPSAPLLKPTSSPSPGGLTTGQKAGIGVGVSLGVLFISALIVFLIILWRRTNKLKTGQDPEVSSSLEPKAEATGKSSPVATSQGQSGEVENSTSATSPVEGETNNNMRAELEGGWTGWEAPGRETER